jgi:hypothetical protein
MVPFKGHIFNFKEVNNVIIGTIPKQVKINLPGDASTPFRCVHGKFYGVLHFSI